MKYLLLVMLFTSAAFAVARNVADKLAGTWNYTVSNVPPEYEKGSMTFEEKGGKMVGYLGETDRAEMKELAVTDNKVTFKVDFQGGMISLNMVQKGDSLMGMVVTNDGEFPIAAVRAAK
ncbi:hypothetical protein [Dyadobacter sp. CY343]|uniref:hypothetical protein n=1 Tax=Dyadobacter sp. CY343 TaxID=2907299 RepID=UPI001F2B1208|nr:hypothetical protein [Dyadobacter sp. CY343]MCE7060850.1 hypothetical protein [Dyadobacter sp. CY343]